MKRPELEKAVRAGIISAEQADHLTAFYAEQATETPHFSFVHVLYYLGGMIAIGAMSLFMTLGWTRWAAGAVLSPRCSMPSSRLR